MSVRRIYKWQCDCCQVSEETYQGLPEGWIASPSVTSPETLHFCGPKCARKKLPPDGPDVDDAKQPARP